MSNVVRLISASGSDFEQMNAQELKESIFKSESRVIMGLHRPSVSGIPRRHYGRGYPFSGPICSYL